MNSAPIQKVFAPIASKMTKPAAWQDLFAAATARNIYRIAHASITAHFQLDVARPSGRSQTIALEVIIEDSLFRVREATPTLLPASCPQMHIEENGLWCLGWEGDGDLSVTDRPSADLWWGKVEQFAKCALRAKRTGVWHGPQRAHGGAAAYEALAERAALAMGGDCLRDLAEGRLRLREHSGKHGKTLKLVNTSGVVASAWLHDTKTVDGRIQDGLRLIGRRRACPCPNGSLHRHRSLMHCDNHSEMFDQLLSALRHQHIEETKFWDHYRNKQHICCNAMKQCPLRTVK